MPLSEHEQKILEEIERRLIEDDPGLARRARDATLPAHLTRRIRLAAFAFVLGFLMLPLILLPSVGTTLVIVGFVVMLVSGLVVYHYLKRLGRDQIQTWKNEGRFTLTGVLARLAERFRGNQPPAKGNPSDS
jgi:lipopolysaccharide export LptBFGC system permease protein LptF